MSLLTETKVVNQRPAKQPEKQRGFALLTVLLVVALVSLVTSELLYDQQVQIKRSAFMVHQAHSTSVAFGFESWVKKGLSADAKNNQIDHLKEQWAQPLAPVAFADGLVSGQLLDLNANLNLNNVIDSEQVRQEFWQLAIERYLTLNLKSKEVSNQFDGFSDVLTDWIDADDEPSDYGAESETYLLKQPAYRAANQSMVMVSELQNLQGMERLTEFDIEKLQQHLTALPSVTTINVNTASKEVLMALADWMTEDIAQQWVLQRKESPAEEVGFFLSFMEQQTGFESAEIAQAFPTGVLSVNSDFFLLHARVDYGEVKQVVSTIFNRKNEDDVILVQRWLSVSE